MKISILLFLISLTAAAVTIDLGPAGRVVFPLGNSPMVIENSEDFNGVFFSDNPVFLAGADIRIHLLNSLSIEVSGLFGEYDPYFEYPQGSADSTEIKFCEGSLAVASLGLQKNLGDIVLLAGSDINASHEKWQEATSSTEWGYHREASNTVIAPYAGTGISVAFSSMQLDFDLRMHFPDLKDQWISAGCSLLFF